MITISLSIPLFLGVITVSSAIFNKDSTEFKWNQLTRVNLDPSGTPLAVDTPQGVTSDTAFILLQGHVLPPPGDNSLDLSIQPGFLDPLVSNGRDIGLLSMDINIRQWYIRQHVLVSGVKDNKATNTSQDAWLLFSAKRWSEPLPGGCCANRSSQGADNGCAAIGPTLRVLRQSTGVLLEIKFEPAAALVRQHGQKYLSLNRILCDSNANRSAPEPGLRYRLYVAEASDSVCHADWPALLRWTSTAEQTATHGTLMGILDGGGAVGGLPCCRFLLGSRENLPLVATVVAELRSTSDFSAYTPVLLLPPDRAGMRCAEGLCMSIECLVIATLAVVVGVFLCAVGFRYFSASVFINGVISGSLIVIPVILRHTPLQLWLVCTLGIAGAGGAVGTAALIAWLKLRSNPLAYLVVHLPCCYVLACLLFATPFGRLWWLTGHEGLFLTALGAALLLCLLLLMLFDGMGALFSLSLAGTTLVVFGVSTVLPLPVTFPYLFVDLLRRTAYQGYHEAVLFYNFYRATDIILTVSLPAGTALSCLLQFACNRRDGFDPSLRHRRRCELPPSSVPLPPSPPPPDVSINATYGAALNAGTAPRWSGVLADERTPLMATPGAGRQLRSADFGYTGQRSV